MVVRAKDLRNVGYIWPYRLVFRLGEDLEPMVRVEVVYKKRNSTGCFFERVFMC